MKQELRCHAVLCPREDKAKEMALNLQNRLHQALVDFKKEKISRQNARLSLANSIHDNPSMPYRKLLLQVFFTICFKLLNFILTLLDIENLNRINTRI
jgi:hypothetical protein